MTRYEAYITLYYALSNEAGKEDGLNENLNRFLERMFFQAEDGIRDA